MADTGVKGTIVGHGDADTGRRGAIPASVLIVSGHPLLRTGLAQAIAADPRLVVAGQADSAARALALSALAPPAILVCDLVSPGVDGLALAEELLRQHPQVRVAVLTPRKGDARDAAVRAGAVAAAGQDEGIDAVLALLRRVARGERPIEDGPVATMPPHEPAYDPTPLTTRELQVLRAVARGERNKEIATALGLSPLTIKNHMTAILRKLGVADRTQAVVLALRRGWVEYAG